MAGAQPMGHSPVGPVPQTAPVTQAENTKSPIRPSNQGQRQGQACRRPGAVWSAILAYNAILGTAMDEHCHISPIGPQWPCQQSASGKQGRERQADAFPLCSTPQAPGLPAGRPPSYAEGCVHPHRPRRNETTACGSVATWKSETRSCRRAGSQAEYAHGLEELPLTVSPTMDGLYESIHDARKAAHGQTQGGPGKLSSGKDQPEQLPVCSWLDSQRGQRHEQRQRGCPTQRVRVCRRSENCSELSRLSQQSTDTAHASRPSCAVRSGSTRPQETQNRFSVSKRTEGRYSRGSRFWRGRVNTTTACIAHQPGQPRGEKHNNCLASAVHVGDEPCHFEHLYRHCDTESSNTCSVHAPGGAFPSKQSHFRDHNHVHDNFAHDDPFHRRDVCEDIVTETHHDFVSPSLKWLHSITCEPDFKDEWTAQDQAFHLAFQLLPVGSAQSMHANYSRPFVAKSRRPAPAGRSVSFAEELDLLIGLDEDLSFIQITIPMKSLAMQEKPWSMSTSIGSPYGSKALGKFCSAVNDANHFPCLNVVGRHPSFVPSHQEPDRCSPNVASDHVHDVQPFTPVQPGTESSCQQFPFNRSHLHECDLRARSPNGAQTHAKVSDVAQTPHADHQHSLSSCSNALPSDRVPALSDEHESKDSLTAVTQIVGNDRGFMEKNSLGTTQPDGPVYDITPNSAQPARPTCDATATSHSRVLQVSPTARTYAKINHGGIGLEPRHKPSYTLQIKHEVPHHECRLDHESPIAEFTASLPADAQQIGEAPPGQNPNQPAQPAFADELSAKFMRMGYDVFDRDFDVPVRTWYIDHATIRRWTAPRNLQLAGPPHLWEQQFSSIWIDQLNPNEWYDVIIVSPDPPRTARNAFLIMDLIVTQSLQMNRFPGLITIIPDIHEAFEMHSIAASFEPFVSGFEIAQAADATGLCQHRECTVTFGWQEIPFTLRRHHVMANGDGFQLSIRGDAHRARSSSSQAGSSTDSVMSRITSDEPPQSRPRTSPSPSHVDDARQRFTTPLHLFQLEGQEVVVQLLNAQLAQPSHDMADALRVPLNCIEAIHIMPIAPDGFPELAIPAIVQRVGDIDVHSTDRLIVIDTIYHHHPTPEGTLNQPTVVRTVQRVTEEVTRPQLLFKAAVLHYCQHLREACAVSLDGFLWPINHVQPRPVRHGSYATVDVPPPFGTNPDTRALADAFHAEGTRNAFFRWLVEPDDMPEDAMQLTQVFAAKTVIGSVIKHRFRWSCRHCPLPPEAAISENNSVVQTAPTIGHDKIQPIRTRCTQPKCPPLHPSEDDHLPHIPAEVTPSMHHVGKASVAQDTHQCTVTKRASGGQTKLSQFFKPSVNGPRLPAKNRPSGQTSIQDFFTPLCKASVAQELSAHAIAPTVEDTIQTAQQATVVDLKCTQEHVVDPPVFTTNRLPDHQRHHPEPPPRPAWRIHLGNIFDEYATVVHQETGPVLQIEVWYIHHQDFPICEAPRMLELDDVQELWYADMCNLWFDRIHRHEAMKVLNVLPPPPHQARPRSAAHIILEQGFSPERLAVHFTAVFLGGTHLGLFQRVESTGPTLCTKDMIDSHGFQVQCAYRPCNMHSGYIRFQMDVREEIFSGIGVVLTVAPPPREPWQNQPTEPPHTTNPAPDMDIDLTSMMQQPSWPSPRLSTNHEGTYVNIPTQTGTPHHATMQMFDHRMTPAAITEFRATLHWQYAGATTVCSHHVDEPRTVRTWYLHSDRCIRTEESRTVQLRPQPHTWHVDIIQRWADRLDPDHAVHLHVVMPNPPRSSLQPEAHVILVQKPNPLWRSTLLTVTQPEIDPWHLTYVCAMLDAETDIGQLSFISGVGHPSNPLAASMRIVARQGQVVVPSQGSFPVRHGYWFDIQAHFVEPQTDEAVTLIQRKFRLIHKAIRSMQDALEQAENKLMMPLHGAPAPSPDIEQSVTVWPNDPNTFVDAQAAMAFFTALQAHWQPLALLNPPAMPALVPVVTWYLDHIRYPQCFQPRLVLLNHNPTDWIQRIRSVWIDLVMPDHLMTLHLVQPHPPEMPAHIAAHILVVQQPMAPFRSTLFTTFDSALPMEPPRSHATIAPTPIAFATVTALAYRDVDCQQAFNDCAAWVGQHELPQNEDRPIINGHSIILAVHRRPLPIPDAPAIWDSDSPTIQPPDPCRHAGPTRCEPASASHGISGKCSRVSISLEAVIPEHSTPPQLDDTKPQLLWFEHEAWLLHLSHQLPCVLHPLPDGLKIPDVSYWPLLAPMAPENDQHDLTLYLDGAANGTHAAWAVIATVNLPEGEVFVGCMHGCVHLDSNHPLWIGADAMDNIAAELTALAMAQTLALRWPYPRHAICIRPDLSLSRLIADAITTCRTNTTLAQLCRVHGLWLASKVHMWEIRGHQGFAWNELADAVAKHALCQGSDAAAPAIDELHRFANCEHDMAWAWMQTTHPALAACFPSLVNQQVIQFSPPSLCPGLRPIEQDPLTSNTGSPMQWSLKVVSANVLAAEVWAAHIPGSKRTGQRTLRLDNQWDANGSHVVGVQEARTAPGQYTSPHYRIFASGATTTKTPLYGCELWLHKTKPIGQDHKGNPVVLGDAPVSIVHADPRRLFAVVSVGDSQYTFVVLHAPCQASQGSAQTDLNDTVADWWHTTCSLWEKHATANISWAMIDANAPVAAANPPHTGAHGLEPATKAGEHFMHFLVNMDLALPCTFNQYHTGPTKTWSHATGKRSRKDYVAVQSAMLPLVISSWVDVHHDNTFAHEDHLPVVLLCRGWVQHQPKQPPLRWDECKLLDPQRCRDFQQALMTLPVPQWQLHVDDHAALQERQFLQLGQQFFAPHAKQTHRIQLTQPTLDIIALKRQALDYGRASGDILLPQFKEELKLLEKEVHRRVRADTQAFYDDLLDTLDKAGELHNHRLMYKLLNRLGRQKGGKPKGPRPLPMLRKPNGDFAATFTEQQQMWMDQFGAFRGRDPLYMAAITGQAPRDPRRSTNPSL